MKRLIIINGMVATGKTMIRYYIDKLTNFKYFISERWVDTLYVYSKFKGDNFSIGDARFYQKIIEPYCAGYILLTISDFEWYRKHLKKYIPYKKRSFEVRNLNKLEVLQDIAKRFDKLYDMFEGNKIKIYINEYTLDEIFNIIKKFVEEFENEY